MKYPTIWLSCVLLDTAGSAFTIVFRGTVQLRQCAWAVAESEALATLYTIGVPPSSRQPVHGPAYKNLRKLLGLAVPLENDGSTCVVSDPFGARACSVLDGPDCYDSIALDENASVSTLCRHNALAANQAGKSGLAQVWTAFSDAENTKN